MKPANGGCISFSCTCLCAVVQTDRRSEQGFNTRILLVVIYVFAKNNLYITLKQQSHKRGTKIKTKGTDGVARHFVEGVSFKRTLNQV